MILLTCALKTSAKEQRNVSALLYINYMEILTMYTFPTILEQQASQYDIFHDGSRRESGDSVFGFRVKCNNGTFFTSVFKKKTFTGLYTKCDSFTARKYKMNLIRTLTDSCLRLCATTTLLQGSFSDLKKTLLQNGYPNETLWVRCTCDPNIIQ